MHYVYFQENGLVCWLEEKKKDINERHFVLIIKEKEPQRKIIISSFKREKITWTY
jgi:hypothetical protein